MDIQSQGSLPGVFTGVFTRGLYFYFTDENNITQKLSYDYTYNSALGLMQEDFDRRSILLKTIDEKLNVHMLHPIDLIISKIARFSDSDEDDIKELIKICKIDRTELYGLASDAIKIGIGFPK